MPIEKGSQDDKLRRLQDTLRQRISQLNDQLNRALAADQLGEYNQALTALVHCQALVRTLVRVKSGKGGVTEYPKAPRKPKKPVFNPLGYARAKKSPRGNGKVILGQGQTRKPGN